jgi:hypothetical protein
MKITFYLFFLLSVAISSSSTASSEDNNSLLKTAHEAFKSKDYSTALTDYQIALSNLAPQENQQATPTVIPTVTILNKVTSFFSGYSAGPPSNSKNIGSSYICLKMGDCYVHEKKLDQAVSMFDMGTSLTGDNKIGNECLLQKGFYEMHEKDYLDAYHSMKEYVRRNVDKNSKEIDTKKMQRACFIGLVSAWKLNKSGVVFENDMTGSMVLAVKAKLLMSGLDNRIYFKK